MFFSSANRHRDFVSDETTRSGPPGTDLEKKARRSFAGSAAPNRRHFSRPGGRYKNCHLRCGHVHLLKSKKAARRPPHTRPAGPKRRPSSRRIRGDNRLLLFPCCSQPLVFVRETDVRTVARPCRRSPVRPVEPPQAVLSLRKSGQLLVRSGAGWACAHFVMRRLGFV